MTSQALWNSVLWVGDVTLGVTLILVVAWLGTLALKKNASFRHAVWVAAFAAIVFLPIVTLTTRPAKVVSVAMPASPAVTPLPKIADDYAPSVFGEKAAPVPAEKPSVDWRELLGISMFLWPIGILLAAVQAICATLGLRSIYRDSIPDEQHEDELRNLANRISLRRAVGLRTSLRPVPPSAMTWGTRAPIILLPQNSSAWPQELREGVLLHELAHVRRFDCFTQLLSSVVCALFWFHPGVWLAARAMRAAAETAADDAVIRAGVKPADYAAELVALAAAFAGLKQPHTLIGVPILKRAAIESRIRSLIDPRSRRNRLGAAHMASFVLAGTIIVGSLAYLRPKAAEGQAGAPSNVTLPEKPSIVEHKESESLQASTTSQESPEQVGAREARERAAQVRERAKRFREQAARERARAQIEAQREREMGRREREREVAQAKREQERDAVRRQPELMQAERERQQAIREKQQAEFELQQGEREKLQAERERRQEHPPEQDERRKELQQAQRDQEQRLRDQEQAARERQQAQDERRRDLEQAARERQLALDQRIRDHEQAQRDRQQGEEERQRDLAQAQQEANREKIQAQIQAQQAKQQVERERQQEFAQAQREKGQAQAEAQREAQQAEREKAQAQAQAQREKQQADQERRQAEIERLRAKQEGERARMEGERTRFEGERARRQGERARRQADRARAQASRHREKRRTKSKERDRARKAGQANP